MRYTVDLADYLSPARLQTIAATQKVAAGMGVGAWLVGGTVRDVLHGIAPQDMDICVEADAAVFATNLVSNLPNARMVAHSSLLTAQLVTGGGRVDIASARSETYSTPAAFPRVIRSDILRDLARRDFSINSIALRIDRALEAKGGTEFGASDLLDPYNGVDDLKAGVLRILHRHSFRDDPTRVLRAARYAAKFGFELTPASLSRLRASHVHFKRLDGGRIYREYDHALASPCRARILELCEEWGVNEAVCAGFVASGLTLRSLRNLPPNTKRTVYWSALIATLDNDLANALSARIEPPKAIAKLFAALPQVRAAVLGGTPVGSLPKPLVNAVVSATS